MGALMMGTEAAGNREIPEKLPVSSSPSPQHLFLGHTAETHQGL